MLAMCCVRLAVAIDGLAPSKGFARLIYSQLPLLLGTNRRFAVTTEFEPAEDH